MTASTLTPPCRGLIDALLAAPVAWQSPAELARATDSRDEEETTDTLAALDAGGWLAVWEREGDIVVTLSVAAASTLGVRLVEVGPDEVPRWAGRGEPEPRAPRSTGVFVQERAARLELVVDAAASAEAMLEAAEEERARSARPTTGIGPRPASSWDGLPRPTLFVGSGLSPWPGPGDGRKASCPACLSRRLIPTAYCLVCDRWGLDHLLVDLPAARRPAATTPQQEALLAERQREARKRKRQRRKAARRQAADAHNPRLGNGVGRRPA